MDEFMSALERSVTAMRVGDPLSDETEMGPLISDDHRRTVAGYVPDDAGGDPRAGPDGPGFWYPPTVLAPVSNSTVPRRGDLRPGRLRDPLRRRSRGGRAGQRHRLRPLGSIRTRDGARALRVARAIETGVISINSNSSVRVTTPFGGFKQSGVGRELGPDALDHYTEVKNVYYATEAG